MGKNGRSDSIGEIQPDHSYLMVCCSREIHRHVSKILTYISDMKGFHFCFFLGHLHWYSFQRKWRQEMIR